MLRKVFYSLGCVAVLLLLALAVLKVRYGGGQAFPDVSTAPELPAAVLEKLITLDYPPGNVAVGPDGRIFFAYHPFAQADRFSSSTVFELVGGKPVPFPNTAYQTKYQGVFGMTVDRQRRLWCIEPASLDHENTRLIAFDLNTGEQSFEYRFPPKTAQFAQDLRVSPDGGTVFLADTGLFRFTNPGLIVFDVATKTARILLADHPSAQPEDWVIRTPLGPHRLGFGLITFAVGLDGITLDANGEWLYYGTMSHHQLFRVPTAALKDSHLTPSQLAEKIEIVGPKPLSDGIDMRHDGSILITDVEHGGIARLDLHTKRLTTLVRSPKVVWADGVVNTPDGSVLFTDSAIPAYIDQLARPPSATRLQASRPFAIYRFKMAPPL